MCLVEQVGGRIVSSGSRNAMDAFTNHLEMHLPAYANKLSMALRGQMQSFNPFYSTGTVGQGSNVHFVPARIAR